MRVLVPIVVALALAAWLVLRQGPERAADVVVVPASSPAPAEAPAPELIAPNVIAEEGEASPEARRKVEPARAVVAGHVVVDGGLPATIDARVVAHAHRHGVSRLNSLRVDAPVARDGSFSLEVPAESSSVTLDVEAELLSLEEDVEVRPGRRDVELRPRVLALVRGHVHAAMGVGVGAIARARLSLSSTSSSGGSVSYANSDEDGSFSIPCWEMDRALDLIGMAPAGPAEGRLAIEALHPGEIRDVDLFLEPWIAPYGVAVEPNDRPIEGALVNILDAPARRLDGSAPRSVLTDSDGRFGLERLAPGTWELEVVATGRTGARKTIVLPRDGREELRFVLAADCVVRGRVLDADGAPCASAIVSSDRARGFPSLTFSSNGVILATGSSPREDADAESGVNQARILYERSRLSTTDGDGSFALKADCGPVRLIARARGFAQSAPLELGLEPGEHREDVVLRLRPVCVVRGHVVDEEGKAVRLPLSFEARDGGHVVLMTDAKGWFESDELPAGPGLLSPFRIGHAQYTGSLEIEPTPGIELDVELQVVRTR